MESNIISPERDRRTIERSAAYPGINLEDAIKFATIVSKYFPSSQAVSREDIAAVLKKSTPTVVRDIAACVQFTLFTKDKDGYKISPRLKTILNYIGEEEKFACLAEAFKSPKLYASLIEKFDGHVIPPELKTHLIRFHKIAEKAAPEAAEIFIQSAVYAGVLSENNILNVTKPVFNGTHNPDKEDEIIDPLPPHFEGNKNPELFNVDKKEDLLIPEMFGEEKVKVRLTENKFCYLIYPQNLNAKDVEILRKQIEMLEIIVK